MPLKSVRSAHPRHGRKGRTGDVVTRSADAQRRRIRRAEDAPTSGRHAVSVTVRRSNVGAYSALEKTGVGRRSCSPAMDRAKERVCLPHRHA